MTLNRQLLDEYYILQLNWMLMNICFSHKLHIWPLAHAHTLFIQNNVFLFAYMPNIVQHTKGGMVVQRCHFIAPCFAGFPLCLHRFPLGIPSRVHSSLTPSVPRLWSPSSWNHIMGGNVTIFIPIQVCAFCFSTIWSLCQFGNIWNYYSGTPMLFL